MGLRAGFVIGPQERLPRPPWKLRGDELGHQHGTDEAVRGEDGMAGTLDVNYFRRSEDFRGTACRIVRILVAGAYKSKEGLEWHKVYLQSKAWIFKLPGTKAEV